VKKILLTRPRAASEKLASLLAERGFECMIDPLLMITPTNAPRPDGHFQAVMATSAHAFTGLDKKNADLFSLPCFCVGEPTGHIARSHGFTDVRCGASDGAALAAFMLAALADTKRPLLHLCGEIVEDKARHILNQNDIEVISWVAYRADAVDDFSPETHQLFKSHSLTAIPLFSPRSAQILTSLITKNHLATVCSSIVALGLSQAVVDVLQILPWKEVRVAKAPSEEKMIESLADLARV